jgi:hypothetical protein
MKEETLEEFKQTLEEYEQQGMEKYAHEFKQTLEDAIFKQGFLDGAKWQAERMYDVLENLWSEYRSHTNNEDAWSFKEWLVEQFKKK